MPYRIAIDGDRRLIVRPEGRCDLADSQAMLQVLAIHVRTGAATEALLDLRKIDYTPSYSDVRVLAEEAGQATRMPLALVVTGAFAVGVANQFASFADDSGTRVGVFADPAAAADWLSSLNKAGQCHRADRS